MENFGGKTLLMHGMVLLCSGQKRSKTRARRSLDISSPQPKRRRRRRSLSTIVTTDDSAGAVAVAENEVLASWSDVVVAGVPGSADDVAGKKRARRRPRMSTTAKTQRVNSGDLSATAGGAAAMPASHLVAPATNAVVPAGSSSEDNVVAESAADAAKTKKRRVRRALKVKSSDAESAEQSANDSVCRDGAVPLDNDNAEMISDIDEELPPFNKVNSSFTVGDLIWVKHRQYPFWPALVSCVVN